MRGVRALGDNERMTLRKLAAKFLRIGATGFGGPMALIGLMQHHLVEKSGDVSSDDFAEGVAIGQVLPGPVAVDCATHIGYRLRGLPGAIVSTGSIVLPAFLLMLVVTPLYLKHGQLPQVAGFFKGVGPAVVAVIIAAAWRMGKKFIVDAAAAVIAIAVAVGALMKVNPILLIVAAGILGALVRGRGKEAEGE